MALAIFITMMLVCSLGPAAIFAINLRRYRRPRASTRSVPTVSVLIPARNEEENIGECLKHVLASRFVHLEVLVLDDGSTDRTSEIAAEYVARDPRVRLGMGLPLPAGWNGKQHACWLLAQEARSPLLLFLDADVRLEPEAISRCAAAMRRARHRPELLSGFPRQVMKGWTERMLLPLIHFVLLGYLPLGRMRRTLNPSYAAGCGQFFLAEREAYFKSGGHAGIRATRHDGLMLPRLMREKGFATELVDLTELAHVRMYHSARGVWEGLAKNATEGLGAPGRIVPITMLLFLGQILPTALLVLAGVLYAGLRLSGGRVDVVKPAETLALVSAVVLAALAGYLPRLAAVRRFGQPLGSALLHPLGVAMLLALQWYALARQLLGRPVAWRARSYEPDSGAERPGSVSREGEASAAGCNDDAKNGAVSQSGS